MRAFEMALINDYQRDFPLDPHPFETIAGQLSVRTDQVLGSLRKLAESGVISRIGPVFRPNTVGSSTLAAVMVPQARIDDVAACISAFEEVNHNYQRDHEFNLWFVVNAESAEELERVMTKIAASIGLAVMSLPLEKEYHIDLGFKMDLDRSIPCIPNHAAPEFCDVFGSGDDNQVCLKGDLVELLQNGLPITEQPYAEVGRRVGMDQQSVVDQIRDMLDRGTIRRFGIVVRHRRLGFRSNAMCVWDVPDDEVDGLGSRLASAPSVTLCYRRPRHLPKWPYNLFCMIHGTDPGQVHDEIERLIREHDMDRYPNDILFSTRCFKQRGARYRTRQSIGI